MIAFRIKELMELRGIDCGQLCAATGWDRDRCMGIVEGRIGITCEELTDVAQWLDVPLWALMPGPDFRIEHNGRFYGADSAEEAEKIIKEL